MLADEFTLQCSELAGSVVDPFHDEELGGHAECILEGNFMQFECPYCQRAMKMLNEEAGGLADCPHCGLEIVSPQPDHGDGPRLTEASRRQLGNLLRLKPGNLQAHQDGDQYSRAECLAGGDNSRRQASLISWGIAWHWLRPRDQRLLLIPRNMKPPSG